MGVKKENSRASPLSLRERVRVRGSKTKLLHYAKNMRQDASDAEKQLWKYLRDRRLEGYKFRRQVVIEPFIVDFACLDAKLIIELDGGQHVEQVFYDRQRTMVLEGKGHRVLRFWNDDVLRNIDSVLDVIVKALSPFPHPSPLPLKGVLKRVPEGEGD